MKTVKEIVTEWKDEVDKLDRETIAIHVENDKLFIVTKNAGLYIGYHGILVDKYRDILKDNGYDLKISFVDVFCGNVREF